MNKILILTHHNDATADLVIEHLKNQRANFVRFNTEGFPQHTSIACSLENGKLQGNFLIDGEEVWLDDITAVWNRRPHLPKIAPGVTNPTYRTWAENEAYHALQCILGLLQDRFWINPLLSQERAQFNKWLQMKIASEVKLNTPSSLLSNNPESVQHFFDLRGNGIAIKSIRSGVIRPNMKQPALLHTVRITDRKNLEGEHTERIKLAPVFLQSYIEKAYELRITVVGKKIFACKIDSQSNPATKEDWRRRTFLSEDIPHTSCKLPHRIEEQCLALLERLGLIFGCIDMIVTPQGDYVFLEINPNGQWAWIERLTKLPIAHTIANLLIEPVL